MKALATSQIVLLVLAIIVLAIIGYMVYINYITGSAQFGQTNCQSEVVNKCTTCKTCSIGVIGTFINVAADLIQKCGNLCSMSEECGKQLSAPTAGTGKYAVASEFCLKYGVS